MSIEDLRDCWKYFSVLFSASTVWTFLSWIFYFSKSNKKWIFGARVVAYFRLLGYLCKSFLMLNYLHKCHRRLLNNYNYWCENIVVLVCVAHFVFSSHYIWVILHSSRVNSFKYRGSGLRCSIVVTYFHILMTIHFQSNQANSWINPVDKFI